MGDRSPPPRRSRSRSPPRGGDPRDAKPSEGTPGEFGGMGGERKSGICVGWNHKGFGFIRPDEGGGDDLFCHATQIRDGTLHARRCLQLRTDSRRYASPSVRRLLLRERR
mmetsp:Transcript_7487/g.23542  ORF Transcript_7487/g.23542 Transcript_7487/m.23542 type:complete len:110 (-) Transcript_7487:171-500(-)